ncbi:DUF1488 family protein [Paraburkholderia sediminicola]|uniref:DUF1488 family protein n=1 Tax=Paraburkholderia sediminicola TaxID=458836 RepID=UPI0038B75646
MEMFEQAIHVSVERHVVSFVLSVRGRVLDCAIDVDALEQYFWLQQGANEARILKAFLDGSKRILAVAERKWLAHPNDKVSLTSRDFSMRR